MPTSDNDEEAPSFGSQADIDSFVKHLNRSKRILTLCGAGISAPSGIPTFTNEGAMWKNHKAAALSSIKTFEANPGLVWKYSADRRSLALKAKPNKAHAALAKTAMKKPGMLCITQNIDGLSQRARHPKDRLFEFHGSLFNIKCSKKACDYVEKDNMTDPLCPALKSDEQEPSSFSVQLESLTIDENMESVPKAPLKYEVKENPLSAWLEMFGPEITPEMLEEVIPESELPHCPKCSSLLRPGIVWFGETVSTTMYDEIKSWIKSERKLDLMMVIGTRAVVRPARDFVQFAMEQGAKIAWINLDADHQGGYTIRPGKDWRFVGDVEEVLEGLFEGVLLNN